MSLSKCCFSCALIAGGIEKKWVSQIVRESAPITMYFDVRELGNLKNMSTTDRLIIGRIAVSLAQEFAPFKVPFLHKRYYQKKSICSGIDEVDMHLEQGGLKAGQVMLIIEGFEKEKETVKVVRGLLQNALDMTSERVELQGFQELSMQGAILILTAESKEKESMGNEVGATVIVTLPFNKSDSVNFDEKEELKTSLLVPKVPGIIIVDAVREFDHQGKKDMSASAITDWIETLEDVYGDLDEMVVVLILRETALKGKETWTTLGIDYKTISVKL